MNKNYVNGRAREYRMMKQLKEEGYDIVFRSAGSHSPIDIVGIKRGMGTPRIILIQSKPKKFSKKKTKEISNSLNWLNNEFMVEFRLLSQLKGGKQ